MSRIKDIAEQEYHIPVLVHEVIEYLNPQPHKTYVDATFGGGGHTRAILMAEPTCKVVAFDWDKVAIERGEQLQKEFPDRVTLIWANFSRIADELKKKKIGRVDGVLADFGTSQFQIATRPGFSFAGDTPLDMRMSPEFQKTTAATIINKASEEELIAIFSEYGEERRSRTLARAIVEARQKQKITTTKQLAEIVRSRVPRTGKIHPATRVFQALRLVVNKELEYIKSFLYHIPQVLADGGRLVCISFHSLEDRLVKQYLRDNKQLFKLLTEKVVVPTQEEVAANPSSRSARLRAAVRKKEEE